jgi:hypothetical protein
MALKGEEVQKNVENIRIFRFINLKKKRFIRWQKDLFGGYGLR